MDQRYFFRMLRVGVLSVSTAAVVYEPVWAQSATQSPPASGESAGQTSAPHEHGAAKGQQQEMQHGSMNHEGMNHGGMAHEGMHHDGLNEAGNFLMGESSGTAFQPAAWPMPMLMTMAGGWHFMWMGQAFLVETQQSGPRGGDKLYSSNWGMLGAAHTLGRGSIMLRSMISLEPATVTNRRYPLLFQTGETAYGQPIVDGQHPHDLFMELSVQYARPVGEKGMWNVYYAPVGEPPLGPVAFPHRASAMELPQAVLGHHWQDSTHIASNVLSTGFQYSKVRLEAATFYGREPNENRWNIDFGRFDSWATRVTLMPSSRWMGQFSVGRLHNPEAAHAGNVVRTTASLQYIRPASNANYWATTLLWGRNYKLDEHEGVHAVLAETVVPLSRRNFITGRYEWSQRDELFSDNQEHEHALGASRARVFGVQGFTAGYTRDVDLFRNVQTGIGANLTSYVIASALQPFYGAHPWGVNVFLRVRLKKSE